MPLWEVTTNKRHSTGEDWVNVYTVDAEDLDAAAGLGLQIIAIERSVHNDSVTFVSVRISDKTPGTDIFRIVPVGSVGQQNTSAQALPLFNCYRVDFGTDMGRPSRKYLRCPVMEDQQANGNVEAAHAQFMVTNYVAPMVALQGFVDVDGQQILSGTLAARVAMRQLRRGSKRTAPAPP